MTTAIAEPNMSPLELANWLAMAQDGTLARHLACGSQREWLMRLRRPLRQATAVPA